MFAIPGLFIVFCLVELILYSNLRESRIMDGCLARGVVPVGELGDEPALIQGVVATIDEPPLSPLSQTPCAWYDFQVTAYRSESFGNSRVPLVNEEVCPPVTITDAGAVLELEHQQGLRRVTEQERVGEKGANEEVMALVETRYKARIPMEGLMKPRKVPFEFREACWPGGQVYAFGKRVTNEAGRDVFRADLVSDADLAELQKEHSGRSEHFRKAMSAVAIFFLGFLVFILI